MDILTLSFEEIAPPEPAAAALPGPLPLHTFEAERVWWEGEQLFMEFRSHGVRFYVVWRKEKASG